jgi:aconitate hydratase
VETILNW